MTTHLENRGRRTRLDAAKATNVRHDTALCCRRADMSESPDASLHANVSRHSTVPVP